MIIGITGGIGSGKTTVTQIFSELGIDVVDTDINSRIAVQPGSEGLTKITQKFGEEILQGDGTLDRKKLREIIFTNQNEKDWLETLLHPLIHQLTTQQLQNSQSPYCLLSSPLLLETSDKNRVDRILVVDTPVVTQLERSSVRDNVSEEQIKAIIASQLSRDERLSLADDVIDNSSSLESTREQVLDLHKYYLSLSSHT
ncbi:Dephospho-CoA kinase [Thalassocella blandensis]|nr:Dephospho-CoA kinase [Thalassocella blandensis]